MADWQHMGRLTGYGWDSQVRGYWQEMRGLTIYEEDWQVIGGLTGYRRYLQCMGGLANLKVGMTNFCISKLAIQAEISESLKKGLGVNNFLKILRKSRSQKIPKLQSWESLGLIPFEYLQSWKVSVSKKPKNESPKSPSLNNFHWMVSEFTWFRINTF